MYQILFKQSRLTLFFLLLVTVYYPAYSLDNQKVDSLKKVLENSSGAQRYEVLSALTLELVDVDNHSALNYATQASDLATTLGDSAKIVKSYRLQAQVLRRLDDLNTAIDILIRILPIAKRNKYLDEEKKILNGLAVVHMFRAEYDEALKYHFQSLVIREREGKKNEISITLNNIGLVYFKLKNYETAISYYEKALALKREVNDSFDLDRLLINMGLCYNQLNNYRRARDFINEGLKVCDTACSKSIQIEGKFGFGVSYFIEAKMTEDAATYENAKTFFYNSYEVAKETDNKRWQLENLVYLAKIYVRLNEVQNAKNALTEAEAIAQPTEYNLLLIEIYKGFSELFNKTKDFAQAASYQEKYIHLKDSIYSEALLKNFSRIQTEYAERENIATIAAKEQVIKQQRDLNIAVAVIAILAGLLVLVLQRSNRTIKRVNAQLSEAKEIIEEQNKLLESKNKYLDKEVESKTEDLERVNQSLKQVNDELDNFIYKTSHDIRGPLASLKGMCNVALLDVKDPVALDYLSKLDTTAERLNTILTRLLIINQINNSKLSVARIDFDAIVNDVLLLEKKKGLPQKLRIQRNITNQTTILSDKELIRIVLENLIDNAIKFYNDSDRVDSFVEIHISSNEQGQVKVRVIDNGIGISEANPGKLFRMFFRASERSETGGIGLYIVKTATAKLGGRVGLLTTPEGFTEFYVVFPSTPPKQDEDSEKPAI
ncbi:tetratricopeptide repeat-containing sensor histidine kinase [Ohtaekwangia sp.]|uniref:tetratricopeptide repeat-containing sensor histidine kinase n=1 Tax=Ohtaekwangia sp. TaxID=2066019 RepID=UPI002F95C084